MGLSQLAYREEIYYLFYEADLLSITVMSHTLPLVPVITAAAA